MKDEEIVLNALDELHDGDASLARSDTARQVIAAALRTARNEAIEEADTIVRLHPAPSLIAAELRFELSQAIRSLSSHPAGGHDGG